MLFYLFGSVKQLLPVRARLISGGAELLLAMQITGELNITVGFGKREFHIGQGEWEVVTRNEANRWVFPMSQPRAGAQNWGNMPARSKSRFQCLGDARGFRRYFGS